MNEIRLLLRNHPSWPRSRLSRELCACWEWRRPDGQIKDMACRDYFSFFDWPEQAQIKEGKRELKASS